MFAFVKQCPQSASCIFHLRHWFLFSERHSGRRVNTHKSMPATIFLARTNTRSGVNFSRRLVDKRGRLHTS